MLRNRLISQYHLPPQLQGLRPWSRKFTYYVFAIFLVILVLWSTASGRRIAVAYRQLYLYNAITIPTDAASLALREHAANATLGFQEIIVLTQGTRWRVDGLLAAANLTGLSIQTHTPQNVTANRLANFIGSSVPGQPTPGQGSARAWLAHLDMLSYVVEQGYESALIMEDDADWDISIKEQMRRISDGVRDLLQTRVKNLISSSIPTRAPYGVGWDILWIGHCGDDVTVDIPAWWNPTAPSRTLRIWRDETAVPAEQYSGFAQWSVMKLPPRTRAALFKGPICTFAYAVSRHAAQRLQELAKSGDDEAFDIKLHRLCRNRMLACMSIVPEVVNEYRPPRGSNGESSSEVNALNGQGHLVSDLDSVKALGMGTTANILRSARCAALYSGNTCFPGREE